MSQAPIKKERTPENIEAGARLARSRKVLQPQMSQKEFAETFNEHPVTYNNWERGIAPIPKDFIQRFRRRYKGFGYDWFWHGEMTDIPEKHREKLLKLGGVSFGADPYEAEDDAS